MSYHRWCGCSQMSICVCDCVGGHFKAIAAIVRVVVTVQIAIVTMLFLYRCPFSFTLPVLVLSRAAQSV